MTRFARALRLAPTAIAAALCLSGATATLAASTGSAKPTAEPTAPLRVAAAFEPVTQISNGVTRAIGMEAPLSKELGVAVSVTSSRSLRQIAIGTRSGDFDVLWIPSNLAVGAIKNAEYEIVGFDGRMDKMALLVGADIGKFEDLKGRTLYLPQEDSLASVAGTALLSGHSVKLSDFGAVFISGSYEVGAFAIGKKLSSATVLPETTAKAWLDVHPGQGRIIELSAPVPGQTLVVKRSLNLATKQRLASWFAAQASIPALARTEPAAYKYITGLGHYTPDEATGVRKVTAGEVTELTKAGAQLVDVRTSAEFEAKHIPTAKLLPYTEYSPRMVGADLSHDGFDVTKLAGAKKVIVYCNGPECWKSFKAAVRASASKQFDAVYWFRGGMPEWERSGHAVTAGLATSLISGALRSSPKDRGSENVAP